MKYKLDYTAQTTEERINVVNKILEQNMDEIIDHFDNHFNVSPKCVSPESTLDEVDRATLLSDGDYYCKQLERMADYILYGEKRENNIQTQSNKDTIARREPFSFEQMYENGQEVEVEIIEDTRRSKKPETTKEDLAKYPEIKKLWDMKKKVKKIKATPKLKRAISSDLGYSINKLKISLSGQFNFRTSPSQPQYVFDSDTGYFNDAGDYILVSENIVDFNNPKHIFELINNYAGLVDQSYEDCQSDIRHFLYVLEDMIKKTNLPDYMFDIIVWKIDGITNPEIVNELQIKYGLVLSEPRVSTIYRDIIPQKICETYKNDYEDWLYTYRVRGAWKKCSVCGEIKLATERNFYKEKTTKDGFRPECINCFKKSVKNE